MDEIITIENGEIIKVIPPVPEVPAIPAVPEQKITLSKEELLSEISDSQKRLETANVELKKINMQMSPLLSKQTFNQNIADIETKKQADYQIILDNFPEEPLIDNVIEE
jgi:hypothetical protein